MSDQAGQISILQQRADGFQTIVSRRVGYLPVDRVRKALCPLLQRRLVEIAQIQMSQNIPQLLQQLILTATELSSQIRDANGNISQLQQTAAGIMSTVSNQAGQISQLWQTAAGIQTTLPGGLLELGNVSLAVADPAQDALRGDLQLGDISLRVGYLPVDRVGSRPSLPARMKISRRSGRAWTALPSASTAAVWS